MSPERSHAYSRVLHTLAELGPSKLQPAEQDRIRNAADSLLFCVGIGRDDDAREAFEDADLLLERLIESGRWERKTARQLADDLWACGPEVAEIELPQAA